MIPALRRGRSEAPLPKVLALRRGRSPPRSPTQPPDIVEAGGWVGEQGLFLCAEARPLRSPVPPPTAQVLFARQSGGGAGCGDYRGLRERFTESAVCSTLRTPAASPSSAPPSSPQGRVPK